MLLLCMAAVQTSNAAPVSDTQFEQYQAARRQAEQQQAQIQAPSVQLQETRNENGVLLLPKEYPDFRIHEFVIDQGKSSRFDWMQEELEPYKDQLIGAEGINLLAKMLSEEMISRGFVTSRIVVPEQNLKSGVLRFRVVPGYIEDIRFEKKGTFGNWRSAFPCQPGDILNIRDIEQGLEQLRQVPNQQAEVQLEPGSKPGQSIIIIKIIRTRPWTAGMDFNDSGLENTGRLQSSGDVALYNLTGANDILSYDYTKDAEHHDKEHGTKDTSLSYTLPYGDYTFHAYRYYDEFYQQVPALIPFESRGKTTTWDVGFQRVICRDRIRKIQYAFKILRRWKESYVDGEEIRVQRLDTTAYQIGLMQRQYVGNGVIDAMAGSRTGSGRSYGRSGNDPV